MPHLENTVRPGLSDKPLQDTPALSPPRKKRRNSPIAHGRRVLEEDAASLFAKVHMLSKKIPDWASIALLIAADLEREFLAPGRTYLSPPSNMAGSHRANRF